MYTTPDGQTVKRHPIRGFFWGLLMGLGITVLLIITNTISIGTITSFLVLIFSALFGIIWGLFAPPKKAKGQAPYQAEPIQPDVPVEAAAATAATAEASEPAAPPAEPVQPLTPEQSAASRETVVKPAEP